MKSSTAKTREVNIEFLRIISMLLVLIIHYNVSMNGDVTQEMVLSNPWKAIGVSSLKSLSFVCVNCFILISGYFEIHWKWSGLCKYLFQISFWGGLVHLLAVAFGFKEFSICQMLDNMTLFLIDGNWFFITYLGLYLFSPVLNAFIEKSTTKQLGLFIIAYYLFQSVFGWIFKNCIEFSQGLTFVSFIGLYLLGAYLKRTDLNCLHWKSFANLSVYLGVGLFCVVLSLVSRYLGATKDVYSYISPLQIIQTIYLFLFCKRLNWNNPKTYWEERRNSIILFFSSSAFAALLMHSWDGGSLYWGGLSWINKNIDMPFFASMSLIFLFFVAACCFDKLRMFCWMVIIKRCERNFPFF